MNPLHFFRLVFAYRGHHRDSTQNSGFVMPLVILVGLTLTVVGFAMMQRASSQKNDATSKEATAKALSVAEAGVTRVTDMLNAPARRFIATLPACNDPPLRQAGQACNDASSGANVVPNWSNIEPTQMQNWTTVEACETLPPADITTVRALSNTANWQPLPQGEFRLVGYQFTPDPGGGIGKAPGTGTLVVEGAINRGQANEAVSSIQVTIPVQPGPVNNVSVPGLWVTDTANSSGSVTGGNRINGDILVNDCSGNLAGISWTSDAIAAGYTAKYTSAEMPAVPPLPATCNNLTTINNDLLLPQRNTTTKVYTDTPTTITLNNGNPVTAYVYCVPSIDLNGGNKTLAIETLDTRPTVNSVANPNWGARHMVIFHVTGNVKVQGNANILHKCPMTSSDTTSCDEYKTTDFNLYGRAPAPIGSAPLPEICLGGSATTDAFILAPEYLFGVSGSGSGGGVKGTVMVKQVATSGPCGSNTSNVVINQTGSWDDMVEGIEPQATSPVLSAFSS